MSQKLEGGLEVTFKNRVDAGKQLAKKVQAYLGRVPRKNIVVIALPRGGVIVGAEVAKALRAPLDIVTPKKIGHPQDKEFAMAAVSGSGLIVWDQPMHDGIDGTWYRAAIQEALQESKRRRGKYLGTKKPIPLFTKTVIIVDDGMATGLTMLAAIAEIRQKYPSRIVVAVPVADREAIQLVKQYVESVIIISVPRDFTTVATHYQEFDDISDQEVMSIVKKFGITKP